MLTMLLGCITSTYAQPDSQPSSVAYVHGYDLQQTPFEAFEKKWVRLSFADGACLPEKINGNVVYPQMPVKYFYIGLPADARVSLSTRSLANETLNRTVVSPFSDSLSREQFHQRYAQNPFYQSADLYPAELASVVRYFYVGNQYVAQVQVAVVQAVPAKEQVVWHRYVKVAYTVQPAQRPPWNAPTSLTHAEEHFLQQRLVNYEDAKKWRVVSSTPAPTVSLQLSQHPLADWYQPTQPYVKIYTANDGVHRVTGRDIEAAGVSLNGVDPRTLRLLFKGNEIPIALSGDADGRMDADDEIEFIGAFHRGSPEAVIDPFTGRQIRTVQEYRDYYSDTCVYWLTWGGALGRRVRTASAAPVGTGRYLSFQHTQHIEQDTIYNVGYYTVTERTPAEGWFWKQLQVNNATSEDTASLLFSLDGVQQGGTATLRVKLTGFTNTSHTVSLWFNGVAAGSIRFNGLGDTLITAQLSASAVRNGANAVLCRLQRSAPTAVDIVGIDWCEVDYPRDFSYPSLTSRQLVCRADGSAPSNIVVTELDGAPSAVLYNMTDTVRLTGGVVSGRTLTFSAEAGKRYLCASPTAIYKPTIRAHRNAFLRNTANSAEYIIITHPSLLDAANRLAAFRQSPAGGQFRTFVATTEDIYAEFSFGFFTPLAIKRFLQFAFENWRPPRPRYVVLLGSANWDAKHHLRASAARPPLVPVYGNPVSDIWFTSFNNDPSAPYINIPRIAIGRIPAQTPTEANAYLDKLTTTPRPLQAEAWHKNFIFVNGGIGAFEQQLFRLNSNSIITSFVLPRPIAGTADTLYRDDASPFVSSQLADLMRARIASGATLVNYVGHAGSQTWDLTLSDPRTLQNRNRYPLVLSWTCHTGRFAEPFGKAFGEQFVIAQNAGALGFIGTAGWGFIGYDDALNRAAMRAIQNRLRTFGDIWLYAETEFRNQFRFWNPEVSGIIDQYNILGDPAAELMLAQQPDLSIVSSDVRFINEPPSDAAPEPVAVVVRNFGLATQENVQVTIRDRWAGDANTILLKDTLIAPVALRDSLIVRLDFSNKPGQHELEVRLDERSRISEVSKDNNAALVRVVVSSTNVSAVKPLNFSRVHPSQRGFTILHSSQRPAQPRRYEFELDTSRLFNSPMKRSSGIVDEGETETTWQPSFTPMENIDYFWRARQVGGAIEQTWSVFSVRYDASVSPQAVVWSQQGAAQFQNFRLSGLRVADNALTNDTTRLQIRLRSLGNNASFWGGIPFYEISVGNIRNFELNRPGTRGLNIIILDTSQSVSVSPVYNFDLVRPFEPNPTPIDNLVAERLTMLLDSLKDNQIVLVALSDAVVDIVPYFGANSPLVQRFRQLGSRHFERLTFRESWVFVGSKNRQIYFEDWGKRCEPHFGCDAAERPTRIDTFLTIPRQVGVATSEAIGMAASWQSLSWQQTLPSRQSRIAVTAQGIRLDGRQDSLLTATTANANLSNIDARVYPQLRLRAELQRDPVQRVSPSLQRISVEFTPAGDAALSHRLIAPERDTVEQGEVVQVGLTVRNIGFSRLDSIPLRIALRQTATGAAVMTETLRIDTLAPNAQRRLTTGLRALRAGAHTILAELDPENRTAELTKLNNTTTASVFVRADTIRPTLTIEVDGKRIQNGDLIGATPRILIAVSDNSALPIADTSLVRLTLNNRPIFYSDRQRLSFTPATSTNRTATVIFTPQLADGDYDLFVAVRDASGNIADSASARLKFTVNAQFGVESLFNYPNPFSDKTVFAFTLTGSGDVSDRPTDFRILIYTVAGRMVRELNALPSLQLGRNQIEWDGRDADGDQLANGVYIYRVVVRTPTKTYTKTERLAIIR